MSVKLRTKLVRYSLSFHDISFTDSPLYSEKHHEAKEVRKAGKKVKTFETQKLVKKLKDARCVATVDAVQFCWHSNSSIFKEER